MKQMQKDIDMVCTFIAGKPPQPHRFRVTDRDDRDHVYKIRRILQVRRKICLGKDVWRYRCQGKIGEFERLYEIQFNIEKAAWQLVKF